MVAKISATYRKAFLGALAETGTYSIATDQVRVSRDWAYKLRRRDAGFAAECRTALAQAALICGRLRLDRIRTG